MLYNWRKKYAGLMPSEMKRLRQLEEENAKLKRIVADLSLDKAMLQDVLSKKLVRLTVLKPVADRRSPCLANVSLSTLSVARQAKLLVFSRGSIYYLPRDVSDNDLALMRRIDELHLEYPFAGSRMLQWLLRGEGLSVGRLHVATLMKKMGIEAIYRRPNTSKPALGHKVYPYLLRKLAVTRPNQVWAMDISYIPMARGFVYLCTVVDWFSRKVLSWRLSITREADFCIEAVEEALARHSKPDIFNTDSHMMVTGSRMV